MYRFTNDTVDLDALRARLAEMPDDMLQQFGRAAASMARRSDREVWRIQLAEARAEWRRRHPRATETTC